MPIVAVVLMLVTPRARTNGPAFLLGWIVGIALAGAVLLAIAGPSSASEQGEPAAWVNWLKLVLGLLLVLVAVRRWRARPHEGEEVPTPRWMGALDNFTPPKAAGAAVLLGTINPRTSSSSWPGPLRWPRPASPPGRAVPDRRRQARRRRHHRLLGLRRAARPSAAPPAGVDQPEPGPRLWSRRLPAHRIGPLAGVEFGWTSRFPGSLGERASSPG
jgi:hypothetical protein